MLVNLLQYYIVNKSWIQSFCQLFFVSIISGFVFIFFNWLVIGLIDLSVWTFFWVKKASFVDKYVYLHSKAQDT